MGAPCRGWCRFERRIGTFGIPRGMDRGAFCRQGRPRGGAEVPPRGTSLSRLPGPAPPQRWKHWPRPGLWAVAVQSLPNVAGADLQKADHDAWTPAHIAAFNGHVDALRAGVNLNSKTNDGDTPADNARRNSHKEALKLILEGRVRLSEGTSKLKPQIVALLLPVRSTCARFRMDPEGSKQPAGRQPTAMSWSFEELNRRLADFSYIGGTVSATVTDFEVAEGIAQTFRRADAERFPHTNRRLQHVKALKVKFPLKIWPKLEPKEEEEEEEEAEQKELEQSGCQKEKDEEEDKKENQQQDDGRKEAEYKDYNALTHTAPTLRQDVSTTTTSTPSDQEVVGNSDINMASTREAMRKTDALKAKKALAWRTDDGKVWRVKVHRNDTAGPLLHDSVSETTTTTPSPQELGKDAWSVGTQYDTNMVSMREAMRKTDVFKVKKALTWRTDDGKVWRLKIRR
eukprot:s5108_g6.t3